MRDALALHRYLAERAAMPFAWGDLANDCVSFAAGAATAQTGRTYSFGSATWSNAAAAARALKAAGGLDAAVSRILPPVSAGMAERGDIALIAGAHGPLLAIVEGDLLAGPGVNGIERIPRSAATKFWSVE